MITTEAWILEAGPPTTESQCPAPARLKKGLYSFPDITGPEVLVEPIYGCWEANMTHAIQRDPVDICRLRGEEQVVIGNAGVVRVLRCGAAVSTLREGDLCLVFCSGVWDRAGYPIKIFAYDAPGTVGILAKQAKLHVQQLIPIPQHTRHSLCQWAAFSLRFITAWANWKTAYGCWQVQSAESGAPAPIVWGWGGGVTLAELRLAKFAGCQVAMLSSDDARLALIRQLGIQPIDRRQFGNLNFDPQRYRADPAYRSAYQVAESAFLDLVGQHTAGQGVSVFIDLIGLPVFRATLKALARPGVITTAGWKAGMNLSTVRALECMSWHIHVHTHYARYADGLEAVQFAERTGWLPSLNAPVSPWECIPQLLKEHLEQKSNDYYPLFQVNAL